MKKPSKKVVLFKPGLWGLRGLTVLLAILSLFRVNPFQKISNEHQNTQFRLIMRSLVMFLSFDCILMSMIYSSIEYFRNPEYLSVVSEVSWLMFALSVVIISVLVLKAFSKEFDDARLIILFLSLVLYSVEAIGILINIVTNQGIVRLLHFIGANLWIIFLTVFLSLLSILFRKPLSRFITYCRLKVFLFGRRVYYFIYISIFPLKLISKTNRMSKLVKVARLRIMFLKKLKRTKSSILLEKYLSYYLVVLKFDKLESKYALEWGLYKAIVAKYITLVSRVAREEKGISRLVYNSSNGKYRKHPMIIFQYLAHFQKHDKGDSARDFVKECLKMYLPLYKDCMEEELYDLLKPFLGFVDEIVNADALKRCRRREEDLVNKKIQDNEDMIAAIEGGSITVFAKSVVSNKITLKFLKNYKVEHLREENIFIHSVKTRKGKWNRGKINMFFDKLFSLIEDSYDDEFISLVENVVRVTLDYMLSCKCIELHLQTAKKELLNEKVAKFKSIIK